MCTSGTEGIPKGAMLTEKNIMTNIADISLYFHITSSDSILISRPLYHCAVLTGEFLTALLKGTKIRFYSGPFHPAQVLKLLEQHEITVFCGTPTLIYMMARLKRAGNKCCLKHICISGECMGTEIAMRIAKGLFQCRYLSCIRSYGSLSKSSVSAAKLIWQVSRLCWGPVKIGIFESGS